MYTHTNYPSGKALKEDFKSGKTITVFQPGGLFHPSLTGNAVIEGPHYPKPHTFYVAVEIKDGVIIKIKK